ncbi:MAG: hypothetical protein Q9228_007961, partial [Teloschistes exilis]
SLRGEVAQAAISSAPAKEPRRILLLDGFLLFTPSAPSTFRSLLDLKILLRAPYVEAKQRREVRSGYDTMEGWWQDPPGYFDKVVWPNYVAENGGFFVRGDVDGEVDGEVCKREKVKVKRGNHGGLGEVLKWVVEENPNQRRGSKGPKSKSEILVRQASKILQLFLATYPSSPLITTSLASRGTPSSHLSGLYKNHSRLQ